MRSQLPLWLPQGGPSSGARDPKVPIPLTAAARTGPDGGPEGGIGDRQRLLPLRAEQTRPSRHQRIQVGRSMSGVLPQGAPRRIHPARRHDPAPSRSEGEYRQGCGRPARSNNPRLPLSQGPRPRPLQRPHRLHRSRAGGVIFRQGLQRSYMCRGLLPLHGLASGIAGNRITAGGPPNLSLRSGRHLGHTTQHFIRRYPCSK
ncbi:hypothetical protein NDU88_003432 [Pleurodeles waltl]|uniref:Uncharacterized protein n=1 Tax=Pleurodeles waltl TaxID=8319 RepID=A0AAV7RD30_PLEWA|nr:hypothetical protein NDU88_003432 [Pleurodeles waltl]